MRECSLILTGSGVFSSSPLLLEAQSHVIFQDLLGCSANLSTFLFLQGQHED